MSSVSFFRSSVSFLVSRLGIELQTTPPYNLGRKMKPVKEGFPMDEELKKSITELLDVVTDTDLLDLVYKILLSSITEKSDNFLLTE